MNQPTVRLVKLKEEGRLQKGDIMHHSKLGEVTVAFIRSNSDICVRDTNQGYHSLSLNLSDAKVQDVSCGR